MFPLPAVTSPGTAGTAGTTNDRGPGQNCAARRSAVSGQAAESERACSRSAATSGSGFPSSRPLARRTAAPAAASSTRPPRA
jgi:hypothetical protein